MEWEYIKFVVFKKLDWGTKHYNKINFQNNLKALHSL